MSGVGNGSRCALREAHESCWLRCEVESEVVSGDHFGLPRAGRGEVARPIGLVGRARLVPGRFDDGSKG